jgi:glucosamine kinase
MNELDRIAVGVDAGGTSTRVAVSRAATLVGRADGPGANASVIGVGDAADAIVQTIRRALAHERPDAIVIGAAGAGRAAIARTLEDMIGSAFDGARVVVGDDAAIALRAAIPAGPGIVLVAGTGSVAYAEHGDRHARIGGLGYLAGDEGSAYAIGMAAVRQYGRVLDGRARADETADLVARALAAPDRDAYLSALYDGPPATATIAALAPAIIALAGQGNRIATKIVQQAGSELGDLVKAAARAVDLTDTSPAVALQGGLFGENSLLSFLVETRVIGDLPGAAVVRGGDGGETGALRIAESVAAT